MKPKIFIPAVSLILFITLLNIHCNKDDDNSDFVNLYFPLTKNSSSSALAAGIEDQHRHPVEAFP